MTPRSSASQLSPPQCHTHKRSSKPPSDPGLASNAPRCESPVESEGSSSPPGCCEFAAFLTPSMSLGGVFAQQPSVFILLRCGRARSLSPDRGSPALPQRDLRRQLRGLAPARGESETSASGDPRPSRLRFVTCSVEDLLNTVGKRSQGVKKPGRQRLELSGLSPKTPISNTRRR